MGFESLVNRLSRSEQIAVLQLIWEKLASSPEGIDPPDWHQELLSECRRSLENGSAKLVDWVDAKKRLRERHE